MSRAVFMSACGDPFLPLFCLKLFKERWYDEVDRFYIDYNNNAHVSPTVVSEFLARASQEPKVHIIYHPNGVGNGVPITEMTLIAKEENIMLLEDDGYCFSRGKIDGCFKRIESGEVDALGSPRGSCGMEVWDGMKRKYNLDYSGYGDVGPNFWPNFFFCKRKDLLATDMNFGSKEFTKGVYYKEFDSAMTETQYGDTFVWADIQMRYNGVRFGHIPQFHASPTEAWDKQQKVMNWINGKPYWVHGGSLSSGLGGYLSGVIPPTSTDQEKMEIESRVAWWTLVSDVIDGFTDFKVQYKQGIIDLVRGASLQTERIQEKINIYKSLLRL